MSKAFFSRLQKEIRRRQISTRDFRQDFGLVLLRVSPIKNPDSPQDPLPTHDDLRQTISKTVNRIFREKCPINPLNNKTFLVLIPQPSDQVRRGVEELGSNIIERKCSYRRGRKSLTLCATIQAGVAWYQPGDNPDALIARAQESIDWGDKTGEDRITYEKGPPAFPSDDETVIESKTAHTTESEDATIIETDATVIEGDDRPDKGTGPHGVISFNDVSKIFNAETDQPVVAVDKLSFAIQKGEIVSFVGPSGCGKTTVLRILAGLETPSSGDVIVNGEAVKIGTCGMVFQSYSSFPWLTVLDNVAFGLKVQGSSKEERYAIAKEYIELVGLSPVSQFENRYPKELSGGQKQRVAIARSLAVKNEILLMDEPFGALDIQIRAEMQESLLDICRKLKPTVILVTHDIQEAIYLPNRVFVFSAPSENGSRKPVEIIEIEKEIDDRRPDWKKTDDFEDYMREITSRFGENSDEFVANP